MKALTLLTAIVILAVPVSMTLGIEPDEYRGKDLNHPWMPEVEPEKDLPWWETTTMDSDGNQISDILDSVDRSMDGANVIVSYSREITRRDKEYINQLGLRISSHIENIDALVLGGVPPTRIEDLTEVPGVVFVEPLGNPVLFSDIATPTVKAKQSDLFSPHTAWDLGYSGEGVSLAVIDTGIDDEHPSLQGKFLGGVDMTKPDNVPFLYPQDGSYNPDDIQGHGSTCSGIATGTGAPDNLYQGTAPSARLVDVRIGTKIGYAPGEFWVGAVSDPNVKDGTLRGIDWAIEHREDNWGAGDYQGIDIFSISWGVDIGFPSDGSDAYSRLLDQAVESGVIVVNAAGNDGPENDGFHGLSASSNALIVAASDDNDTMAHDDDIIAFYSSRGPRTDNDDGNPYDEMIPDIAAPGTHINNMQPDTRRLVGDASENGYGNRGSGTSYATPTVAGVIALVLEANPELKGRHQLVEEMLKATAERMKPPTMPELDPFWDRDFGYGQVDAYKAVRIAEVLDGPDSIDTELQAHITYVEGEEPIHNESGITPQYVHHNITGPTEIKGLGWARMGEMDHTEYRIDEGEWRAIPGQSNESFNPWTLELSGFRDGSEHRLWVRSVGGDSESLPAWIDFTYNSAEGESEGVIGGGVLTPVIIIGLLAALGVGAFMWYRHKKVN